MNDHLGIMMDELADLQESLRVTRHPREFLVEQLLAFNS